METAIGTLIESAEAGERPAAEALFAALYEELHRLARRQLARNSPGLSLGATSLLHEAYLDISSRQRGEFPDRGRFMAYAARVMRSVIIDYSRRRRALKRGGGFALTTLDGEEAAVATDPGELEAIGDALDRLAALEPTLAEVVDLKFFCGFTFAEIAALRGVTERTAQRHWDKARIYLRTSLRDVELS